MPGKVIYRFRDNNNSIGQVTMYLSDALSLSGAEALIIAVGNALQSISNALLFDAEYRQELFKNSSNATPMGSNIYRRVILLFTDEENSASLVIPSYVGGLFEEAGDYVNIRSPGSNTPLPAIEDIRQALAGQALTPTGEIWPDNLVYIAAMESVE